jgi:hypothetical protein
MRRPVVCFLGALLGLALKTRADTVASSGIPFNTSAFNSITGVPVCDSGYPLSATPFPSHCAVPARSSGAAAIVLFDPFSGNATPHPLTTAFGTSPFVNGIAYDAHGNLVFAGADGSQSFVGRLQPDGTMTKFTTGLSASAFIGSSHVAMAKGPAAEDTCWIESIPNRLGCIAPAGQITEHQNPNPGQLVDIAAAVDGNYYASDFGGTIVQITPQGAFTSKPVPQLGSAASHPGAITVSLDRKTLYFTDRGQNAIGILNTASGNIALEAIPTPNSNPLGITVGQDDRVYFNESATGKLGRLDPSATTPTIAEFPGLSSVPAAFLTTSSELASGSIASLLAWKPGAASGAQLDLVVVQPTSPCPPATRVTLGPFVHQVGKTAGFSLDTRVRSGSITGLPHGMDLVVTFADAAGTSYDVRGTPTTPGSYHCTFTEVDANGCPVKIIDFFIVVAPKTGTGCDTDFGQFACLLLGPSSGTLLRPEAAPAPLRFWLALYAVDPRTGNVAAGEAIPQNDEFGYFSFPRFTGDPTFPEVMIKMLDARSVACCFWLFHTGLTDLQYTLTVFDTVTGSFKQYQNDRSDPSKLCGGADTQFFDGVTQGSLSAPALPTPQSTEPSIPGETFIAAAPGDDLAIREASASCLAGANTICLLGNRFSATLTAVDPRTGNAGVGTAIPQKDNFGYFSLPSFTGDPTFPEVFIKMADARSFTCCFWVFHSGLTDLEYTLTVTDTTNGAQQTYHNNRSDPSKLCGGADTSAFH